MNLINKYELVLNEYINSDTSIKEICSKYHVSDSVIYNAIREGKIEKRKKYGQSYKSFSNNWRLFFYVMGLVASDGYLYDKKSRIEIGLHLREEEFLRELSKMVLGEDHIYIELERNRVRLMFQDKDTYCAFKNYGLFQKKSKDLDMDFGLIPKNFFCDFMRGYIDGDGNYRFKNINNIHISITGNKKTMYNFQKYVYKYYGIESCVYQIKTPASFQMYRWTIQKTPHAKQLIKILYHDAEIFMERKYNIIKDVFSAV